MKRIRKSLIVSLGFLSLFILWTVIVKLINVKQIGPQNSEVGLAGINQFVHNLTGVHFDMYTATDILSIVPLTICIGFGILGLLQWVKRKSFRKVDRSILALGGLYAVTLMVFILFETLIINFRPVLIEGKLEASYPSSTTMLVMCVMLSAMIEFGRRISNKVQRRTILIACTTFTLFMVVGRFISGVHWFSDIIGGILLSVSLVSLFYSVTNKKTK